MRHFLTRSLSPSPSDLFEGNAPTSTDGDRIATVLMYLNTPEGGGETAFPRSFPDADWHEARGGAASWSECGRSGAAARAVQGDALLFFSLKPEGKKDDASMHAGCPPTAGIKWVGELAARAFVGEEAGSIS